MGPFIAELKRRNVFKVGVAYAIVAWLLIQVAATVLPTFDAPRWVLQTITFLIILGFPLALFLAWAYELTPEGIKPTQSVSAEASITRATGQKLNHAIIALLSLAVVFLVLENYVLDGDEQAGIGKIENDSPMVEDLSGKQTSELSKLAIAVLPFTDMSPDRDQEYFSDGLSEEILNQLVQYDDLRVIGRTSSFAFKGLNEDLRVIGDKLGVTHILEGSVRKANNQLRITAQLIRADDGSHLLSKTFDRELLDVFAIQEEIATAVATALSITLDAGDFSRARGGTNNLDAYDAYLRGNEYFSRRGSGDDFINAVQYFREATELDPGFVRAWGRLYSSLEGMLIYVPDQVAQARQEMEQVRKFLSENHPDSSVYLGIMASWAMDQRRWLEAETAYNKLTQGKMFSPLDITPDTGGIISSSSVFLLNTGHFNLATPRVLEARKNDPLSLSASYVAQIMLFFTGRYAETEAEYQRGLTLAGNHFNISMMAYLNNFFRSDLSTDALHALTLQNLETYPEWGRNPFLREIVNTSDTGQKKAILHRVFEDDNYQTATGMLMIAYQANIEGDTGLTLAALRRSYIDYNGTNVGILWAAIFKSARQEPGFKTIVRDLGLVDYWRSSGNWGDFCRPLGADDFQCE